MVTLKARIKSLEHKIKLEYPIIIIGQNTEPSTDQQKLIQLAEAQNKIIRIIQIGIMSEDNQIN